MKLAAALRASCRRLQSKIYWAIRSIRSRIFCWYIKHIWDPLHPEIQFTDEERAEATDMINQILHELNEEERTASEGRK